MKYKVVSVDYILPSVDLSDDDAVDLVVRHLHPAVVQITEFNEVFPESNKDPRVFAQVMNVRTEEPELSGQD